MRVEKKAARGCRNSTMRVSNNHCKGDSAGTAAPQQPYGMLINAIPNKQWQDLQKRGHKFVHAVHNQLMDD